MDLIYTEVGYELIFSGHLNVIPRLELTVEHGVLLHAHERASGRSWSRSFVCPWWQLLFVTLHPRHGIIFHLTECLAFLLAEIFASTLALMRSTLSVTSSAVNSPPTGFSSFSMAWFCSIWLSNASVLALSFESCFSTEPLHTNVYLLATDSIFVPSIYCTFNDTKPSS